MAKEREKAGQEVTLFAPLTSVERLMRAIPSIAGLSIHDFETRTSVGRIRSGLPDAVEWLGRLPSLEPFDTVICDNLPEILELRSDAIISAHFFWHEAVQGSAKSYVDYCIKLLKRHQPLVLGCELFSMDSVRSQPGFIPVGLYKIPELVIAAKERPLDQRTDLLVTGGTTPSLRKQLQEVIRDLIRKGPHPYKYVRVDPELMPDKPPAWMVAADFSVEMYCSLKASICRPGLGVLTDLLTVGATIYPVFEDGNSEMKSNALCLATLQQLPNGVS